MDVGLRGPWEGAMLDTPSYTTAQMQTLRRAFHYLNYVMVLMWRIGMGRMINCWPAVIGRIMLIRHIGRISGRTYYTPVNYAVVENEIYCAAGFGPATDWHRNIISHPDIQLWLPDGRYRAQARDVSDSPCRARLLRAIIIASGFAAHLFGIDHRRLSDDEIEAIARDYCLVHFTLES